MFRFEAQQTKKKNLKKKIQFQIKDFEIYF
jgi:hypothetical protein